MVTSWLFQWPVHQIKIQTTFTCSIENMGIMTLLIGKMRVQSLVTMPLKMTNNGQVQRLLTLMVVSNFITLRMILVVVN